jgi:hypothetical protein
MRRGRLEESELKNNLLLKGPAVAGPLLLGSEVIGGKIKFVIGFPDIGTV